jgi:leukotriene-A4 hydrolase
MGCEGGWTIEGDSEGEGDAGREENSESDRVVGGKNISAADAERTLSGLDVFLPYVKDYVKIFLATKRGLVGMTSSKRSKALIGMQVFEFSPSDHSTYDCVDIGLAFWNGCDPSGAHDMTLAQQSYTLADRWSKTKDTSEFSATDISGMDANQIGEHEYRS